MAIHILFTLDSIIFNNEGDYKKSPRCGYT
nr:MAG TPA: hypothetical protein [Caudoviricetes sp.]